jgi:hypothetical protein
LSRVLPGILLIIALFMVAISPCLAADTGTKVSPYFPASVTTVQKGSGLEKPTPFQLTITKPKGIVPYQKKAFPKAVVAAIAYYTDHSGASVINSYLRDPEVRKNTNASEKERIEGLIKNMDYAEGKSRLVNQAVLFRGIGGAFADQIRAQSRYTEPGYASTSYDFSVTYRYANENQRDSEGYANILVLQRDGGDYALFVDERERELIIPKGTTWNLVKEVKAEKVVLRASFRPIYPEKTYTKVKFLYIKESK